MKLRVILKDSRDVKIMMKFIWAFDFLSLKNMSKSQGNYYGCLHADMPFDIKIFMN